MDVSVNTEFYGFMVCDVTIAWKRGFFKKEIIIVLMS